MDPEVDFLIDPMNPLGYDMDETFDDIEEPCFDFHRTLGWVFWQPTIAMYGGTFKDVKAIRTALLELFEKPNTKLIKIESDEYDFKIDCGITDSTIGFLITRRRKWILNNQTNFVHVFERVVLDHEAVKRAVILNETLEEIKIPLTKTTSPFGKEDIVQPGDSSPVDGSLVNFKTIRLCDTVSALLPDLVGKLGNVSNIYQIQMLLGNPDVSNLPAADFQKFITRVHSKTKKLLKKMT